MVGLGEGDRLPTVETVGYERASPVNGAEDLTGELFRAVKEHHGPAPLFLGSAADGGSEGGVGPLVRFSVDCV